MKKKQKFTIRIPKNSVFKLNMREIQKLLIGKRKRIVINGGMFEILERGEKNAKSIQNKKKN